MSTNSVVEQNTFVVPSFVQSGADDLTKSLAGGSSTKNISIKGGRFRMMAGKEQVGVRGEPYLDVIVLSASPHVGRTFYAKKFTEGENATPDCWSADGIKPSPKCRNAQNATCAGCPQDIAGSGENNSKACRFSRKLAVVLEGDDNMELYGINLPATSIFGKAEGINMPLSAYAKYLGAHNCPINAVVTRMSFDLNAAVPKLFFKTLRPVTEQEYNACVALAKTPEAIDAVTYDFKETEGRSEKEFSQPTAPAAEDINPKVVKPKKPAAPVSAETLDEIENW